MGRGHKRRNKQGQFQKKEKSDNMCTIMAIFGLNGKFKNDKIGWELAKRAAPALTGDSCKDGFGYSAVDGKGRIFGEHWLNNAEAFEVRDQVGPKEKALYDAECRFLAPFGEAFKRRELKKVYNYFGDTSNAHPGVTSMILHARMATGPKVLENVHPFYHAEENLTLIHNGVISNPETVGVYKSSCDSEAILKAYIEAGVKYNPANIEKVIERLYGSLAVMVQGILPDGTPYIDIFRNDTNKLYMVTIPEQGWKIFCTRVEIVAAMLKTFKNVDIGAVYPLEPGQLVRMDAEIGEPISVTPFKLWSGWGSGGGSHSSRFYDSSASRRDTAEVINLPQTPRTETAEVAGHKDDDVIADSTIRDMVKQSITDLHGTEAYKEFMEQLEQESAQ